MFLGTPHRGSVLARWAEKLASAISLVKQTNSSIVKVLKSDSEVLARVQDSFQTMILSRSNDNLPPIEITCFYEELPLPGVGIVCLRANSIFLDAADADVAQVVPRESAVLPGYVPGAQLRVFFLSPPSSLSRRSPLLLLCLPLVLISVISVVADPCVTSSWYS